MQIRLVLVPVVAVAALAAPVAQAAPKAKVKPTCNTITDAKGDTFLTRTQNNPPNGASPVFGPQDDALDIVNADLASDGKVVTAVVRIAKLSRSISTSPSGMTVGVDFIIGTSDSVVRLQAALVAGQPDRFEVAAKSVDALPNTPMTFLGTGTGVVDLAKNEVRISAPAAVFGEHGTVARGVKLTPNEAESATAARGVPAVTSTPGQPMTTRGPFADIAAGGQPSIVGSPSCVVPGK